MPSGTDRERDRSYTRAMSFGLGHGRELSPGAWGMDQTDLPPHSAGRWDPRQWFPDPSRRFELEIGSGKGTFLLQQSPLQPLVNFLGMEWTNEFYRYAADRLRRHQSANARIMRANAVEFLHHWCPPGICAVVHLYFSDPWPKSRHHKRRVVQDRSLADIHAALAPQGELRIVTDHAELWAWYEEHAGRQQHMFERLPFDRPESAGDGEVVGTNFERKFRREGRPFHAMTLRRIDAPSAAAG